MLRRLAKSIWRVVGDAEELQQQPEISVHDSWPLGGVWVLEQLWKELGIDKLLLAQRKEHKKEVVERFERALFAMVANRALSPGSKLYCWEHWLQEEVFLPSAAHLELHDFYLGMDFLEEHKAELEKAVFFSVADLMNVDVDLIFYDMPSRGIHFATGTNRGGRRPRPIRPHAKGDRHHEEDHAQDPCRSRSHDRHHARRARAGPRRTL
jgi:hypothetical protein